MPIVSDFIRIVGDDPRHIGTDPVDLLFPTGGRDVDHDALLVFATRGLASNVQVRVNGQHVGTLEPGPDQSHWITQMVYMIGRQIKDGGNILQLRAGNGSSFDIKHVTCFFGQAA